MNYRLRTQLPQARAVFAMALSPDQRWLALTTDDRKVLVYDAATLALVKTAPLGATNKYPTAALFTPDSAQLLAGGKSLVLLDTATWKKVDELKLHTQSVRAEVFAHDSETLYTACGDAQTPREWRVRAWNRQADDLNQWEAPGHIGALAVSPDDRHVAAVVRQVGVAMLSPLLKLQWMTRWPEWVGDAAFTPDGAELVVGLDSNALLILKVADGTARVLPVPSRGTGLRLSARGDVAFLCADTLAAVPLATGQALWTNTQTGRTADLQLSADERVLYVLQVDPVAISVFDRVD
jgi:WD40 repeat protein